ncbi:MAG: hypothetical protein ACXVB0_13730 [Mucilaginibacter sp.]
MRGNDVVLWRFEKLIYTLIEPKIGAFKQMRSQVSAVNELKGTQFYPVALALTNFIDL